MKIDCKSVGIVIDCAIYGIVQEVIYPGIDYPAINLMVYPMINWAVYEMIGKVVDITRVYLAIHDIIHGAVTYEY